MATSVPDAYKELGDKEHVHRFNLRTGKAVISSPGQDVGGGMHVHEVEGEVSSADPLGRDHTHTVFLDGVDVGSGPAEWPMEAGFHQEEVVEKALLPDFTDPSHTYVFRTGEYGIYDYWYRDLRGNYWKYTNAPEDHADFDVKAGVPLIDPNQPQPHTAPAYFTPEGRKRHMGIPDGVETQVNPSYNPTDAKNTWYEAFTTEEGMTRYVYLDSDVRENPDLWVQYQLRVVDAGITEYRQFASNMFNETHPKDKIVGAILMLVEQGLYEVEELADALVQDLEFIDENVKLLGRKFICDLNFYDFLTSLVGGREPTDPLFMVDTYHGQNALGYHYLYSVFKHLRMSPHYILYWRASQMFARVMNRIAHLDDVPPEEVEGKALSELQRMFTTNENIKWMVDTKVRETLLTNYGVDLSKALSRAETDDYGTVTVFSDFVARRGDEKAFSEWLHAEPMHDITPEEEAEIEAQLAELSEAGEEEQPEEGGTQEQPKAPTPSEGASPTPNEGTPAGGEE